MEDLKDLKMSGCVVMVVFLVMFVFVGLMVWVGGQVGEYGVGLGYWD